MQSASRVRRHSEQRVSGCLTRATARPEFRCNEKSTWAKERLLSLGGIRLGRSPRQRSFSHSLSANVLTELHAPLLCRTIVQRDLFGDQ